MLIIGTFTDAIFSGRAYPEGANDGIYLARLPVAVGPAIPAGIVRPAVSLLTLIRVTSTFSVSGGGSDGGSQHDMGSMVGGFALEKLNEVACI